MIRPQTFQPLSEYFATELPGLGTSNRISYLRVIRLIINSYHVNEHPIIRSSVIKTLMEKVRKQEVLRFIGRIQIQEIRLFSFASKKLSPWNRRKFNRRFFWRGSGVCRQSFAFCKKMGTSKSGSKHDSSYLWTTYNSFCLDWVQGGHCCFASHFRIFCYPTWKSSGMGNAFYSFYSRQAYFWFRCLNENFLICGVWIILGLDSLFCVERKSEVPKVNYFFLILCWNLFCRNVF